MTKTEAMRRAKKGAAFLDSIAPDWRDAIDCDSLDIASADFCILGQTNLYQSPPRGSTWMEEHGFAAKGGEHYTKESAVLTDAWQEILNPQHHDLGGEA